MSQKFDWRKMDNIRVIGRFRPSSNTEKREEKSQGLKDTPPHFVSIQQVKLKRADNKKQSEFKATLDYLFKPTTTQKQVFDRVGRPMVKAVLEGYNSTIFAYGQTGSGKTFTMFGPEKTKDNNLIGLVPRCCTYLFDELRKRSDGNEAVIKAWQVSAEFIQLYKEQLLDLLDPKKKARLQIRHNFQTDTPYVANLKSVGLSNMNDMLFTLLEANKNRITASHKLNAESSRSHMLVMLTLEQQLEDGSVKRSKLNFGDLAGSEDITRALGPNPDPDRLKEAIAINSSLSALTTAISALSKKQRPSYRSSALTHILQDSLGGNSKTTMLVAASPHIYNRNESIRTLRFAMTAKTVRNKARVNTEYTRAQLLRRIRELEAFNSKLKSRVIDLETQLSNAGFDVKFTKELYSTGDSNSSSGNNSEDEFDDDDTTKTKKPKLPTQNKKNNNNNNKNNKKVNLSIDSNTTSTSKNKTKLNLTIGNNENINKQSTQQIPSLLKEIEKLNKTINEQIEESKKINDRNVQLELELQTAQSQLNDNRDMYESVKKMNDEFKKTKKQLTNRIETLTNENEKLRNKSDDQQNKLDKQISSLRRKVQIESRSKKDLQVEVKELTLQVEELERDKYSLQSQLKSVNMKDIKNVNMKSETKSYNKSQNKKNKNMDVKQDTKLYNKSNTGNRRNTRNTTSNNDEFELTKEEQTMSSAQVLLNRFASEEVNDFRLTPEEKMKKTAKIMTELSDDIGDLMGKWLPKKYSERDRHKHKALVYQVRQLIGHFNVAVNQLKSQEESYQNDLKHQIKKKNEEIQQLRKENNEVLQLRDDLEEKDEIITKLNKELDSINSEKELLEDQTRQMHNAIDQVQNQVHFLEKQLKNRNSTILQQSTLDQLKLTPSNSNGKNNNNNNNKLSTITDNNEDSIDDYEIKENEQPLQGNKKTKYRKNTELRWRDGLNVGDRLDALDESGLWWTASVVETKHDDMIKIRYDGWGDQYDEWLPRNSNKIQVYKSKYASEKNGKTIIKEGYMEKRGKMFKTWRRRYFMLFDGGTMNYYTKKGDDTPISSFNVKEMVKTTRDVFSKKQKYGLTCETGNRTWKFNCETEQDVKDWIYAINFVKNFQNDDDFE